MLYFKNSVWRNCGNARKLFTPIFTSIKIKECWYGVSSERSSERQAERKK
jgi:hypothetical protein